MEHVFLLLLELCGISRGLPPNLGSLGKERGLQSELSAVKAHQDGRGLELMACREVLSALSFSEESKGRSPFHFELHDGCLQRKQDWTMWRCREKM